MEEYKIMSAVYSIFNSIVSIFQTVTSLFMSILLSLGYIPTPSTETPIEAVDSDNVQLTFVATADTQVNAFRGNAVYLENVLKDLSNSSQQQDAFILAGDVTENSLIQEWETFYSLLGQYDIAENYIVATGNHDIRFRTHSQVVERFTSYYNDFTGSSIDELHYSMEINGYTFIIVGSDEQSIEKQVLHDEQLEWIDETLSQATADGKPVFVICHQPLKDTHGLPYLWNDGKTDSGYIGDQNDELYEILNSYENVVMISGHLHTGFGEYTYEEVGNIHSVNLPAVGMQNADGEYEEYSIGYTVEVYEDEILFRARDFGNGVYVPEYDITIPIV